MLKNHLLIILCVGFLFLQSCDEYKKTPNGLKYKIIADSAGKTGEIGGVVVFDFLYKTKDTVLANSFVSGGPVTMPIQKPSFKGGLEEGFTMLSKGDSAEFIVNADSIYEKTFGRELPKEVKKGTDLSFIIKVRKLYNPDEVKKEEEKMMKAREEQQQEAFKQLESDTAAIIQELKAKNLYSNAKKTQNGVYYIVNQPGTGPNLQLGDTVRVHYNGKLLNGKQFDSSEGKEPISIVLGAGQVIYGWEEALMQLKEGSKATLYIPSPLGYGPQDMGPIPANSNLVFDLTVVDKK